MRMASIAWVRPAVRRLRWLGIPIALALWSTPAAAQNERVTVTVPTTVTFYVQNVSVSTTGALSPSTFSFTNLHLAHGHSLRVSVKAGAVNFASPGGTAIPSSYVSWTVSGASNGTGSNGALNSAFFTQIYQSVVDLKKSGSVNITWRLAPPPAGIRAGTHTLTITWKLESI
jgi:hypothetical protein